MNGPDDARKLFQQVMGQFGAPAFLCRANEVQASLDGAFLEACCRRRDEMLAMVRFSLGTVGALAGDWTMLRPLLASDEALGALREMHVDLQPRLRIAVAPTTSVRVLRRALVELHEAIERFNQRWLQFLDRVDLQRLNQLREGYNRYYVLEKECALGSARIARQGFRRLEPITKEELLNRLPLLIPIKIV